MWLKAKTPIKVADNTIVGEGDPPFELDDAAAAELLALGAADETDAPAPAPKGKAKADA
jgi:hypothetical protein